ncbi:MAG TPA: NAD(P)H-hydrate epimerase [Candidatus Hydrogenedentes bacterium]|nr:NAD(P)H-hydrate epimerase [Candidatus Hydrogenedentota bacterium]
MKTLTAAQMREVDRRCIESIGIPGAVLMNSAGNAVFQQLSSGPAGIVIGKGNNGGDGWVVARLALLAGMEPHVALIAKPEDIKGDAATFKRVYENLGGTYTSATDARSVAEAVAALSTCAVVVDALLGTGISGEVHGAARAAIEAWPPVRTVAVDLPSGLNADTGEACGVCVKADVTVTFAFAKKGFENPAAKHYVGKLVVADIGIPAVCAEGF